MRIIGITGTTGSGKTTALKLLREHGGVVLDCDAVYHDLLSTDPDLRRAIEEAFPGVVTNDRLDRKALGERVFHDAEALKSLNEITHGFVRKEVLVRLRQAQERGASFAAIDAIALFESGLAELCTKTVAITAPAEVRVQRLMAREGITEAYARARIAAQKEDDAFAARCDYRIENNGSREDFITRCDRYFQKILGGNYS